jgi:hypothetical protein
MTPTSTPAVAIIVEISVMSSIIDTQKKRLGEISIKDYIMKSARAPLFQELEEKRGKLPIVTCLLLPKHGNSRCLL